MFNRFFAVAAVMGFATLAANAADAPAKMAGGVLVGTNSMALYTFDKDMAGNGKSVCNGPCATLWPPLMATQSDQPIAPYTLVTRNDGSKQWAYQGKPLYFFQNDKTAADRKGDNFKDVWHLVK